MRTLRRIIIHTSSTPASMYVDAKMIDRWHRQRRWLRIGYHYVIKRDGTLEEGRPLEQPGAHAHGFNKDSVGVVLAGGLDEEGNPENNYTDDQWMTLADKVLELIQKFPTITEVVGHRDLPRVSKYCPCFDVRDWLDEVGITPILEKNK